jgi:predicted dithiol-disulfide oxidoreductase (DUF899 family)
MRDQLAAQRQSLPWVKVTPCLDGARRVPFHGQLMVYHFVRARVTQG